VTSADLGQIKVSSARLISWSISNCN